MGENGKPIEGQFEDPQDREIRFIDEALDASIQRRREILLKEIPIHIIEKHLCDRLKNDRLARAEGKPLLDEIERSLIEEIGAMLEPEPDVGRTS